jgi:membrane-associated protein
LVFSGHYLYGIFLNFGIDLKEHIEMIVIAIVLISTFPVIMKLAKKRPQDK